MLGLYLKRVDRKIFPKKLCLKLGSELESQAKHSWTGNFTDGGKSKFKDSEMGENLVSDLGMRKPA